MGNNELLMFKDVSMILCIIRVSLRQSHIPCGPPALWNYLIFVFFFFFKNNNDIRIEVDRSLHVNSRSAAPRIVWTA